MGAPGGGQSGGRSVASGAVRYDWGARGVAGAVLAGGVVLVVLDLVDRGVRRFFDDSALTTDVVAGVLVLLFTILVVDQVMRRRALSARSKAIAAHVAIVLAQGMRTASVAKSVQSGTGEREAAMDEQRTYMLMLLVAAPVLIEVPQARRFLEDAQSLAGGIARILVPSLPAAYLRVLPTDLDGAVQDMRTSAAPLLAALTSSERTAVGEPEAEAEVAASAAAQAAAAAGTAAPVAAAGTEPEVQADTGAV